MQTSLVARPEVAVVQPRRPLAGQPAFWPALVLVLIVAPLAACAGPQVRSKPKPAPPPQFADVHYPQPQPLPQGPAQAPPAPVEDDDDEPVLPSKRQPGPPPDRSDLARSMRNAALRDQAHAELVHSYFALVETLYRIMPARGNVPEAYDPVPLLRFHGDIAGDLGLQKVRADALAERWSELAAEQGVDLEGSVDEASVAGKLRLFTKFSRCARDDMDARWQHGQRWVHAKADHRSDAELRADPPPAQQFAGDMQLLRKTLDCSRYVARVMRGR